MGRQGWRIAIWSLLLACCITLVSSDHYSTLGIKQSASIDEIRRAYKKLARQYHPDKNKAEDAQEKFMAISDAHEILSDASKRREYDMEQRRGHSAGHGHSWQGHGRGGGSWPQGRQGHGAGHYRRVLRRRPVTQRVRDAYGRVFLRQVWQTVETYEWVSDEPAGSEYDEHGRKRQTGSILEYLLQEIMVMLNDPTQLLMLVFVVLGGVALMAGDEAAGDPEAEAGEAGSAGDSRAAVGTVQRSLQDHAPNVPVLQLGHLASEQAQIVVFVPVVASQARLKPSLAVLRAVQATAASLASHQRANKLRFAWVNIEEGTPQLVGVDPALHSSAAAFLRAAAAHLKREGAPAVDACIGENGTLSLGGVWVAHFTVVPRDGLVGEGAAAAQMARSARKVAVHRLEGGPQGSHHEAGHNLKEWLLQLLEGMNWSNVSSGLLVPLLDVSGSADFASN